MENPRKFKLKAIPSQNPYNGAAKWIVIFESAAAIPPEEIEVIEVNNKND